MTLRQDNNIRNRGFGTIVPIGRVKTQQEEKREVRILSSSSVRIMNEMRSSMRQKMVKRTLCILMARHP